MADARTLHSVALMIAVVAEGLALIRLGDGSRTADAQVAPDSSAVDDLSRRATALDRLAALLDARLRVIEDAQAGVESDGWHYKTPLRSSAAPIHAEAVRKRREAKT